MGRPAARYIQNCTYLVEFATLTVTFVCEVFIIFSIPLTGTTYPTCWENNNKTGNDNRGSKYIATTEAIPTTSTTPTTTIIIIIIKSKI